MIHDEEGTAKVVPFLQLCGCICRCISICFRKQAGVFYIGKYCKKISHEAVGIFYIQINYKKIPNSSAKIFYIQINCKNPAWLNLYIENIGIIIAGK